VTFDLNRHETVFVLTMDAGDNRFNRRSLDRIGEVLDQIANTSGAAALVTTGVDKFYSNGLDLEWAMSGEADMSFAELAMATQRLLARTLTFPRPTVAAINGHCFAAGAMWSLAHDFRVMRVDKGFWSMPEVDIRIPFTEGMAALIQARLSPQVAHTVMTTARRYGGAEAAEVGIVDSAVSEDAVLSRAIEIASGLAEKDSETLGAIKQGMYARVVQALAG